MTFSAARIQICQKSAFYELLEDFDLANRQNAARRRRLEGARLIFGGRRLTPYLRAFSLPKRIGGASFDLPVWSALQIKDAAVGSRRDFRRTRHHGKSKKDLVALTRKYKQVSPSAQLDSF